MKSEYVAIPLIIFMLCPPARGELLMSIDAEDARIRYRKDRKDNYLRNSVDGDLIDNGLLLEGQVEGYARPPAISSTEYRQGSHSLMFQVQPNNRGKGRSEIWFEGSRTRKKTFDPTFKNGSQTSVIPWGEERYTAFSFKLPADYQVGHSNFITQFWQRSPDGPPVSLQIHRKDGRIKCTLRIANDQGTQLVDRFSVTRGVWHDVILHYKFSPKPGKGFIQAWVRPVTSQQYRRLKLYKGAIGFGPRSKRRSKGLFHKFGIYRPAKDNRQHTVFFDEIRNARPSPNIFYELDPSFINPRQWYVLKNVAANAALSIQSSGTVTSGNSAILSARSRRGWQFIYAGEGYYQIISSGKVLEAKQGDNQIWNSGDPIQLEDRATQASQHWYLIDRGSGNYQIINRASRLSLARKSGANQSGKLGEWVHLENLMAQPSQLWRFGS